jgi:hypothetical protein
MNGSEANVAAAGAVLALALDVIEKRSQQRRVEFWHRQIRGRLAQVLLCKLHEQTKGVAIARDGVRARLTLLHEPIHEERLHQGRQRCDGGHGRCPCLERSTRRRA